MIPRSLSASALQTAEACLFRYKHENFDRIPSMGNSAASTGTAVHGALELFVKAVFLEKTANWEDEKLLLDLYEVSYMQTFNSADTATAEFEDGLELVKKWYARTELKDEVISCEVKENFRIKTSVGEIPFNFIWDRADKISDTEYRVVDYKTVRVPVSAEELKSRIQPRAYALAAQIKWPNAERIWVTYDLLRHDPVGIVFTREDNVAFWKYLKRAAERIIATDEENPPQTLNPDCRFCIVKQKCETLQKSIAGGTTFSVNPEEAAVRKMKVSSQIKALEAFEAELDSILVKEAEARDEISWDTGDVHVDITASRRRTLNSHSAAKVLGPELTAKYGSFTLGNIDKILKEENLTPEQREALKEAIGVKWGEPSAKVKPLSPIEER